METIDNQSFNENKGGLSQAALESLRATVPWMKFMSIMGFIGIAFIVIAGFMLGAMSYRNGTTIILLYLAIAVIVFFPTLFLFQYAHNVGYYLESQQMQDLEYAFTRQKYYYIWMGVLLILYLAIILFSVVMNMSRGF